jgi:II/X family phage/plasmid replication protein
MYDTIRLCSGSLPEHVAQKIEQQSTLRQGIDMKMGNVIYQLTTSQLIGSFDSRISVRVRREKWVIPDDLYVSKHKMKQGKSRDESISVDWRRPKKKNKTPVLQRCEPYVIIEGSVHKAMIGHNIWGGPTKFYECCLFLIYKVEQLLGVELPSFLDFFVERVDVARCFELPSFEAVQEWFRGVQSADYARRKVNRYGLETIFASGKSTTVKCYHKGPEFHANGDLKKWVKMVDSSLAFELYEKANRIIRAEVGIKKDKFVYDFGYLPTVSEIKDSYLLDIYDTEMYRFLKEGLSSFKTARDSQIVQDRLFNLYSTQLAGTLFGFWMQLSILGEKAVKAKMSKSTFYRQRKQLVDAGCSWHATDNTLAKFSLIPEGFSPVAGDERELVDMIPEVEELQNSLSGVVSASILEKNMEIAKKFEKREKC